MSHNTTAALFFHPPSALPRLFHSPLRTFLTPSSLHYSSFRVRYASKKANKNRSASIRFAPSRTHNNKFNGVKASASAAPDLAKDTAQAGVTSNQIRLRFAPSPTGSLHVGGARTALYNWLLARKYGGKFIIRIEDTDLERSTRESEESMLNDLRWLGLDWDEGPVIGGDRAPYRQSERTHIYQEYAKKLMDAGKAYPCFCTEEELEKKRLEAEAKGEAQKYDGTWRDADPAEVKKRIDAGETYTVRFKVPPGARVEINDCVRGMVAWDAEATVGDFILLRSSGVPVYNFCVAVDDALMGVSTVIRAEEHLTNTLRQVLILNALGFEAPQYAHCSLILGEDRNKLSKRHGATSVSQFKEQGFLPVAMLNYLALLGWNEGGDKEVYTREELIQAFDVNRVIKSPAVFDMKKLSWLNGQHLRTLPASELCFLVHAQWIKSGMIPESTPVDSPFVRLAVEVIRDRLELVADADRELAEILSYPLQESLQGEEAKEVLEGGFKEMAEAVLSAYDKGELPTGSLDAAEHADTWKAWIKALGKTLSKKGKGLFHPVRLAITGKMNGPDIGEQLRMLHLGQGIIKSNIAHLDERMTQLRETVSKM